MADETQLGSIRSLELPSLYEPSPWLLGKLGNLHDRCVEVSLLLFAQTHLIIIYLVPLPPSVVSFQLI